MCCPPLQYFGLQQEREREREKEEEKEKRERGEKKHAPNHSSDFSKLPPSGFAGMNCWYQGIFSWLLAEMQLASQQKGANALSFYSEADKTWSALLEAFSFMLWDGARDHKCVSITFKHKQQNTQILHQKQNKNMTSDGMTFYALQPLSAWQQNKHHMDVPRNLRTPPTWQSSHFPVKLKAKGLPLKTPHCVGLRLSDMIIST